MPLGTVPFVPFFSISQELAQGRGGILVPGDLRPGFRIRRKAQAPGGEGAGEHRIAGKIPGAASLP